MNESPQYQGMRWFKCDLHMHTPADSKHWRGSPLGDDIDGTAEEFIRNCYESGLELIGITDHNFASKSFLPRLRDAIKRLSAQYGYAILIFPGFEINADVGRGMHVLALFELGSDLEEIDHVVSNCGVPMPRQKSDGTQQSSTKRLPEIIQVVQKPDANGYLKGIVICPHPTESGIFDNERISEWLQKHEWKNPELLAVEVPKPIDQLSRGWQFLFANGNNCQIEWKRPRPMAAVMSSDAKALTKAENDENYIGKRFSWIKMSRPSIESLRQAFLDPESRICLDPQPPSVVHTHVSRIHVKGTKFLQDQAVAFSPHLNCLIGGRGSGKSMLFESIRLGMRGETSFKDEDTKEHAAAKQVRRLQKTFQPGTKIHLEVFHNEVEDSFVVDDSGAPAQIEGRQVEDAPTIFRRLNTLIFSQEEITQLADQQQSLLDFVDSLALDRLESHRAKAKECIDRLKSARQTDEKMKRLDGELTVLKQELEELGRQLTAKAQVQEELRKHRAAQEARRYLDGLQTKAEEIRGRLTALAEEVEVEPPPLGSRIDNFPEKNFFKQSEEKATGAYRKLAETIKAASEALLTSINEATSKHPDWQKVNQVIAQAEREFHAACDAKGLTPEEAEKLKETEQQHRGKQDDLQKRQVERDQAVKKQLDIGQLLQDLTTAWKDETGARQQLLQEITQSETMPRAENGDAIVKTSLTFAGDRESFLRVWGELAPDRRTAAGRAWDRYARDGEEDNIGEQLFDAFMKTIKDQGEAVRYGNPIQWLEANWENKQDLPLLVGQYREEIDRARREKGDKWFEIMLTRVPDAADLVLLRSDGSHAGSFQKGDLSTGQKNTAILSLLLARGRGPVLIDQPEDELDSEFLYHDLVPIFRKAKKYRQLIIVTHNANIPVNADSECVYALKAEGGRGVCRTQGGLDRPDVTQAVLDIMEGSEEAFRRRKEKYHF
jgi:energy-coupling factor transporter ATP-binding protein EcfA2